LLAKPVASKCQAVRGQAEVRFCLSPELEMALEQEVRRGWDR